MNPNNIQILPLPGSSTYISGYYGLEACYARGIIRIHPKEGLEVVRLTINIKGETEVKYWDMYSEYDKTTRTKILFNNPLTLLKDIKFESSKQHIDIPFEIQFPLHDIPTAGFGACSQYLPPSMEIQGSGNDCRYSAKTFYSLQATMVRDSIIPFISKSDVSYVELTPFKVYDHRLITGMYMPEKRIWKSHVGATPIEYDIFVSSSVVGPGDDLIFSYRMLVNPLWASIGIRIREVSLIIKEFHMVGEDRCCQVDESAYASLGHGRPTRMSGSEEVLHWSKIEYPNLNGAKSATVLAVRPYGQNPKRSDNYDGLAIPDRIFPGSDGIYVNREVKLKIPKLGDINVSTARPLLRHDDYICYGKRPRDAYLGIRHSYKVLISMLNCDNISVEAGCYISNVSKNECDQLMKGEPDILPTLDYDKLIGLEVWVPEYIPPDDPKGKKPLRYDENTSTENISSLDTPSTPVTRYEYLNLEKRGSSSKERKVKVALKNDVEQTIAGRTVDLVPLDLPPTYQEASYKHEPYLETVFHTDEPLNLEESDSTRSTHHWTSPVDHLIEEAMEDSLL